MQLLSSLRLYFPVHSYKSILDHELGIHSGLYKSGFFQCLSQFDEFILFANLSYASFLNGAGIKVHRQYQINELSFIILDKTRCLWIHHVKAYLLLIDHAKRINEELRVESD